MPHISTFMYSEGALNEQIPNGQRLHVVVPLLTFSPMFIPGTMSFAITVGILGVDVEKEHKLQIKFINPQKSDEPIVDSGEIVLPKTNDQNMYDLPPDMRGLVLNFNFQNVVFRTEGIYSTTVFLDGDSLGDFPIKVKGKENLL
ncbi:DUF6941 family protein [Metabacillus litoralis]|uniref:DUF6941 family protein n=1 Tax=Metabacillus litoralis TaxID=152268 RepID=UPI00203ECD04|nr:hypothetical protein [Metabacillus litoralis]MCM3651346.1 hypothetical protein [Metabacillus litoralis]